MQKAKPISKISIGETQRELVIIGHRLGLVKDILNQRGDFPQALNAAGAMRSVIDAIVNVGYIFHAGVDKLEWKE